MFKCLNQLLHRNYQVTGQDILECSRLENNRVVQVPTISQVLTLTMLSHPHTQPLTLKERQVGAKTLKCLGCCDLHKDLWPTWAWEFVTVIRMCDYYLESLPFPFPGLDSACTICPHRLGRAGQTVWAPGSTLLPVSDSRHQRLITPPSRVFHHAVSPTRGAWCHVTSSRHTNSRSLQVLQNSVS